MYKCKCWNERDFKEVYRVETICYIDNWEIASSYDKQSDLIEVICSSCNWSTEDEVIMQDNEILILN